MGPGVSEPVSDTDTLTARLTVGARSAVCRVHHTSRMTPARNAGTTDSVWGHEDRESGSMREG